MNILIAIALLIVGACIGAVIMGFLKSNTLTLERERAEYAIKKVNEYEDKYGKL